MTKPDTARDILNLASHLDDPDTDAETSARRRAWIDADGVPTEDGERLARAVRDQDQTRTVFRGL